jgi:hypothetical protein
LTEFAPAQNECSSFEATFDDCSVLSPRTLMDSNQPDSRRDLRFLIAEYDWLIQAQLDQQQLDWELRRLEVDLQLLQEGEICQQQNLDRQLQDDLDAEQREMSDQQRRRDLEEFREQVKQARAVLQGQDQPEPKNLVLEEQIESREGDRVNSPDQYDETRLSAWEIYCLGQIEKPDGVHTRQWENTVLQATGERAEPVFDSHPQWHEYRESLQSIAQREQTRDEGMER